ncbi:LacI family DNA-binding transcriptional regulator [Microbacterium panaciterrae]|uniref:LacI family DNA-binding transcriptional regulator n=1 Tax=Microbacterium panaciterrae TaxID=985759 RepID=A0ABP8PK02_9MICO
MVTIADVAQKAGVSISTVSYVMSGKRAISQDTKDRVEAAIDALEYRPHASARSLASRSTNVIGLQAPLRSGVDVHVVMEIVAGVVREARAHQYDILLLTSDDAEGLNRAAGASMVDALLVMDVESDDPRIGALRELSTPSVLIGLPQGGEALTCVDFDFEGAGALAAERLVERGHTRVALLGAPREVLDRHTSYADRLIRGFLGACTAHGVIGSVHPCPNSVEAAEVLDEVLAADPGITGLLIHNESALAHVAARAAEIGGLEVLALSPADVSRTVPGLADSIEIPAEGIGEAATEALFALLAGEPTPRVRLLPPVLVSRRDLVADAASPDEAAAESA